MRQAVILMLEHGQDGSQGLILNKRTEHRMKEVLGAEMLCPEFGDNALYLARRALAGFAVGRLFATESASRLNHASHVWEARNVMYRLVMGPATVTYRCACCLVSILAQEFSGQTLRHYGAQLKALHAQAERNF